MAGPQLTLVSNEPPPFAGHVLHVADTAVVVRWGPMLRQTIWALGESGVQVSLLTNNEALIDGLSGTDVACHWIPHLVGWRAWRVPRVLGQRFPLPPSIVHFWGPGGLLWAHRWILHHQLPELIYAFGVRQLAGLARWGLRRNQNVAVASQSLADTLLRRRPRLAERCQAIVPAVALPTRQTSHRSGPRTLSVLSVVSLEDTAGMRVLVDAVAQLRRTQTDIQVAIVGDGKGAGRVWRQIHEQRVGECCVVIDEPELWEKGLSGVDVCVVPACQRELWLAPLLAMGMGKLVIASRDQLAEWFVDQRTAWQFTPGSSLELAYLLTQAIEQPRRVRETTALAADYFYARHAVGDLIDRLRQVYSTMTVSREEDAVAAERRDG
jgi:hypothetical protein